MGPHPESVLAAAEIKKGVAFSGSMWGQLPSLDVNGKGSLLIKSGNQSIGRDRWTQTLTVLYRNMEFLIGGIAYTARDTLDPKGGGSCDLNLLTGKGLRNGKPVDVTVRPVRLSRLVGRKIAERMPFLTAAAPVAKQAMALRKRETRYSTGRQRSPTL